MEIQDKEKLTKQEINQAVLKINFIFNLNLFSDIFVIKKQLIKGPLKLGYWAIRGRGMQFFLNY